MIEAAGWEAWWAMGAAAVTTVPIVDRRPSLGGAADAIRSLEEGPAQGAVVIWPEGRVISTGGRPRAVGGGFPAVRTDDPAPDTAARRTFRSLTPRGG